MKNNIFIHLICLHIIFGGRGSKRFHSLDRGSYTKQHLSLAKQEFYLFTYVFVIEHFHSLFFTISTNPPAVPALIVLVRHMFATFV